MMTPSQVFDAIPWWSKALAAGCLVLLTVFQCRARDAAIARTALWQVSWDSTVAAKKITDRELQAAKDTARLLVAQATRREADFQSQLRDIRAKGSHVVVLHDTVPGEPTPKPDTIAQVDLPIVKACSAALDAKAAALSQCQLTTILLQQQHIEDSIAIRKALRKPTASRARDIETGAVIGATLLVIIHALWK